MAVCRPRRRRLDGLLQDLDVGFLDIKVVHVKVVVKNARGGVAIVLLFSSVSRDQFQRAFVERGLVSEADLAQPLADSIQVESQPALLRLSDVLDLDGTEAETHLELLNIDGPAVSLRPLAPTVNEMHGLLPASL